MKIRYCVLVKRLFLAVVLLAVSSCRNKSTDNQTISMIRVFKPDQSTTVQVGIEQLPWLNCAGSDVLGDSLAAQKPVGESVMISGMATVKDDGEVPISAAVSSQLEAEIYAAYSEALKDETSKIENVVLFAAPGVDEVYEIEWTDKQYSAVVSYIIDGTTYDADYVYTLHIPTINNIPVPMACPITPEPEQSAAPGSENARVTPEPVTPQVAQAVTEAPPTAYPLPTSANWRVRMDNFARETLDNFSLVGMTMAVHQKGEADWVHAYGYADLEGSIPATPTTVYPIGSLTMQFTAAAVMQLSESGQLDLNAPLSLYLDGLPEALQSLTLRQLLTHTSMIYDSPASVRVKFFDQQNYTSEMLMQSLIPDLYLDTNGLPYLFSYGNYILAGLIVEKVSGLSYPDYLDRYVLAPAGLQHTGYCQPKPEGVAKGYFLSEGNLVPFPVNTSAVFAAGGLCSTAGDMLLWMDALASGRVVTPDSFQQMITPPLLPDGSPNLFGYGLASWQDPMGRMVFYVSAEASYVSYIISYPQKGLTMVLLSNTINIDKDVFDLIGSNIAIFIP
jgi:CubicO group peptidase (beta-lactamase class C family)